MSARKISTFIENIHIVPKYPDFLPKYQFSSYSVFITRFQKTAHIHKKHHFFEKLNGHPSSTRDSPERKKRSTRLGMKPGPEMTLLTMW